MHLPPKLNLSNSPENYNPSPENLEIQVNTSSQKRPKLKGLKIQTYEDSSYFLTERSPSKENSFTFEKEMEY